MATSPGDPARPGEVGSDKLQASSNRRRPDRPTPGPTPADSLGAIGPGQALRELDHHRNRRLTFVMLFRVVLISLVLGVTTLIYYLSDTDMTTPAAIAVYAIIGATYLLTLAYAIALRSGLLLNRLGGIQLFGDLAIATVIVHVTGGAQSAYTFFFPMAIVGAALIGSRRAIAWVSVVSLLVFVGVSLLGWLAVIPYLEGQEFPPTGLKAIEFGRALALNGAAIVGVALLAINLGSQLQRTQTSLETQSSAAADLLTLHSDIVRSLTSGLVTVDAKGVINSINETAARILDVQSKAALAQPLESIIAPLAVFMFGFGQSSPSVFTGALAPHGRNAGAASSLAGVIQWLSGAAFGAISVALHDGTAVPMGLLMLGLVTGAAAAVVLIVRPQARRAAG